MFRNYARLQALPPDLPLSLTPTRPPADENNFNRPTGPQHQANPRVDYMHPVVQASTRLWRLLLDRQRNKPLEASPRICDGYA
eukprot:9497496-Pyramimonas_sp.AAC.1